MGGDPARVSGQRVFDNPQVLSGVGSGGVWKAHRSGRVRNQEVIKGHGPGRVVSRLRSQEVIKGHWPGRVG